MTLHLRIIMGTAVLVYFLLIIRFMKKKTLALKYTLLWLFAGIGMAVLVIFPQMLNVIADAAGIQSPMNALFLVGICFIVIILMSLTAIVSKQTDRIKNLTQEIAIREKELEEKAEGGACEFRDISNKA